MELIAKKDKCINRGIEQKGKFSRFPLSNEKAEIPKDCSPLGLKIDDFL